ncbi:dehydrogenase [Roseibium aquae]|uniref:Dehydrogenase n=1 Tax=Roseibium aquae TaxID=1323746 RepID=A0A916WU01_9HYPH|nr:NAD(P)H-dependent oxidoreductase [Roseibium aquae]GGB32509.1 dehydrogenase [Roseibium aquae]
MAQVRSIAIVNGHPDSSPSHLCSAIAKAYLAGASAAGHECELIQIGDLEFDLLRSEAEYAGPVPPALQPAANSLIAADHVVLIYPLWLGTLPAATKAFLEQVFHKETVFEQPEGARFPIGKFKGKSARIIVTMGMPTLIYRYFYGAHSLKSLERNIFKFIGFKPVRDTVFGMVEAVGDAKRQKWLRQVEQLGRRVR